VKVTNPIHHAYFTTSFATSPFPHVVVHSGTLHWVVTGLAYALAAVGYFMLLELFDRTSIDARPLAGPAALTALPVAFNVVGYASPRLVDMTYEPIGVAAFSVGVLYVFAERFQTIRLTGDIDDPVVFVDEDGRLKDHNRMAGELFPELEGDTNGERLSVVLPAWRPRWTTTSRCSNSTWRASAASSSSPPTRSPSAARRSVRCCCSRTSPQRAPPPRTPAAERAPRPVRQRHLPRPPQPAERREGTPRPRPRRTGRPTPRHRGERPRPHGGAHRGRARARPPGETIGDTEACDLGDLAETSWRNVETGDATLAVASPLRFEADHDRTVQLFENLFRNSLEHGGDAVTVTVGALDDGKGFYVEDDGPGIPADDRDAVFEPGYTTAKDGTGFGLAIVAGIANAHGWQVAAVESEVGGARFEVTRVQAVATVRPND